MANNKTGAALTSVVLTLATFNSGMVAAERRAIEEVIVTAQKKEEGLSDIPASISVVDGSVAAEAALLDTEDIVAYTPNVKFNSSNFAPALSIRGFGTSPLARSIEPSVGIIVNGVYLGRPTFANDGAYDIERVEVLRGPQGTLYGKNTVSGVLNFTTKAPSYETYGYMSVGLESNDSAREMNGYRVEGGVSFPVIDEKLAARVAFRYRDREFGVYNTTRREETEAEDLNARLRLVWDISDTSKLDVDYFMTAAEGVGNGLQLSGATPRALAEWRKFDPQTEDDAFNGKESSDAPSYNKRDSESLALKYSHVWEGLEFFGDLELSVMLHKATIETPFLLDTDFSPIPFNTLTTDGPELYQQEQMEIRLTGNLGERATFIGGTTRYSLEQKTSQFAITDLDGLEAALRSGQGGQPEAASQGLAATLIGLETAAGNGRYLTTINRLDVRSDSHSFYLQGTYNLNESLDLTLGVRYGEEDKSGASSSETDSVIVVPQIGGQESFTFSGDTTEHQFSWKAAVNWHVAEDFSVFANVSKGNKSGGFSGPLLSPNDLSYKPEEALSKEIGFKSILFDKTFQLNVALFHVDYSDLQVHAFTGVQFATLNSGEAVGQGLEIDFSWLPAFEALTINGSLGYTETEYKGYPCGPGTAGQDGANNPPGCTTDSDDPRQDLTGRPTPFAPKISASLSPSLRFPVADGWGMLVGLDILHQGNHFLDLDLDPAAEQDAATNVNMRFGLKQIDGPFGAVLNLKNLTGAEERTLFLDVARNPGNYVSQQKNDEMSVSIDFRYTFGE